MTTRENGLTVLSEYSTCTTHVGFSLLHDLNQILTDVGIETIPVKEAYPRQSKDRLKQFRHPFILNLNDLEATKGNALLVICSTPRFLRVLELIPHIKQRFDAIAVYFVDGFNALTMDDFGAKILRYVDYVFTPIEEMVPEILNHGVKAVRYLPFGIDALNYVPINQERVIDVLFYGRGSEDHQRHLEKLYGGVDSKRFYVHSTFKCSELFSQQEHRRLHWNMLLRSKINICFEASAVRRFHGRSPVLYRWYESMAAGTVVLGSRPKCRSAMDILNWPNSTIDMPDSESDIRDLIESILTDNQMQMQIRNDSRKAALTDHDWRYRLKEILEVLGIAFPQRLSEQLSRLEFMIDEKASSVG